MWSSDSAPISHAQRHHPCVVFPNEGDRKREAIRFAESPFALSAPKAEKRPRRPRPPLLTQADIATYVSGVCDGQVGDEHPNRHQHEVRTSSRYHHILFEDGEESRHIGVQIVLIEIPNKRHRPSMDS